MNDTGSETRAEPVWLTDVQQIIDVGGPVKPGRKRGSSLLAKPVQLVFKNDTQTRTVGATAVIKDGEWSQSVMCPELGVVWHKVNRFRFPD